MTEKKNSLSRTYFAGNQEWCERGRLRKAGCGVVAACDYAIYRRILNRPASREAYLRLLFRLQKWYLPVIPRFGISPYGYALLATQMLLRFGARCVIHGKVMPAYFRKSSVTERQERMLQIVERELQKDCPVICAIGARLPFLPKKTGITLYRQQDGQMKPANRYVQAHYITITGYYQAQGQTWLSVRSWGTEYAMNPREYLLYGRYAFPFCNRLFVTADFGSRRDAKVKRRSATTNSAML